METLGPQMTLLPELPLDELRSIDGLVIAEVAGRDSVAAMVELAHIRPGVVFLPTIVATGTEFGDFNAPLSAVEHTRTLLPNVRILDPVRVFSPTLWAVLNGRFGAVLSERYPGWSPCAACHLYVHLARAPLSFALGGAPIVTGERDTHDGRFKLSQTPESIDASVAVLSEFGIQLLEPIRHISDGERIAEIVGPGWNEGALQLECVHAGSFKDAAGGFDYDRELWSRYLEEFYIPAARAVLQTMKADVTDTDWEPIVASATGIAGR